MLEDLKCIYCILAINISCFLNRTNIKLAKKGLLKVYTLYDVIYRGEVISTIGVYDYLNKHYDVLDEMVSIWGVLNDPDIKMHELKFKSCGSLVKSIFKATLL